MVRINQNVKAQLSRAKFKILKGKWSNYMRTTAVCEHVGRLDFIEIGEARIAQPRPKNVQELTVRLFLAPNTL